MRKRILIVDDIVTSRMMLKKALSLDYETSEADNGSVALQMLEKGGISLVLLDLDMPVMDGYSLLENIAKRPSLSSIPVIIMTGDESTDSELRALSLGAWDFVHKPFNTLILLFRIKNVIDRSQIVAFEKVKYLVEHDELTGLYNRNMFIQTATNMIKNKPLGYYVLGSFDMDNFKLVNDLYGYDIGDEMLVSTSQVLKDTVEHMGGICCRDHADHFYDLIPYDPDNVDFELQAYLKKRKAGLPTHNINICVGRYVVDDNTISVDVMMDRAGMARSTIKTKSLGNSVFYSNKMRDKLIQEQEIASEMRIALDSHQFVPYLQPKIDYVDKKLLGAELLVRWIHSKKGIISPDVFVPLFERNGFISSMDLYLWEEACKILASWKANDYPLLPISINVSRIDILNLDIIKVFSSLIHKYNLSADLLHLEITESAFLDNPELLINTVSNIRKMGFIVEMDDFGSGYSSLNTLKNIPVDILKLDMKFLSSDCTMDRSSYILYHVIRLAHDLNLKVITEGVETSDIADHVLELGCQWMQGYYFSKPIPVNDFEKNFLIVEKDRQKHSK